jgi:hypothetical protein
VEAGLARYTPHTITMAAQLRRALAEIRRTGLATQREEMRLGLASVAAPVTDATGSMVAALSVVMKASRYQLQKTAPAVRTAAASASRELREQGITGPNPEQMLRLVNDSSLPTGFSPRSFDPAIAGETSSVKLRRDRPCTHLTGTTALSYACGPGRDPASAAGESRSDGETGRRILRCRCRLRTADP